LAAAGPAERVYDAPLYRLLSCIRVREGNGFGKEKRDGGRVKGKELYRINLDSIYAFLLKKSLRAVQKRHAVYWIAHNFS